MGGENWSCFPNKRNWSEKVWELIEVNEVFGLVAWWIFMLYEGCFSTSQRPTYDTSQPSTMKNGFGLIKFWQLANLVWKKSLVISAVEDPVAAFSSAVWAFERMLGALNERVLKRLILKFAEGSHFAM